MPDLFAFCLQDFDDAWTGFAFLICSFSALGWLHFLLNCGIAWFNCIQQW
jgi:hypothetical protein